MRGSHSLKWVLSWWCGLVDLVNLCSLYCLFAHQWFTKLISVFCIMIKIWIFLDVICLLLFSNGCPCAAVCGPTDKLSGTLISSRNYFPFATAPLCFVLNTVYTTWDIWLFGFWTPSFSELRLCQIAGIFMEFWLLFGLFSIAYWGNWR